MQRHIIKGVLVFLILMPMRLTNAEEMEVEQQHNWEESGTNHEVIQTETHNYYYWKNFIRQTGTCEISLKLKTVVYYCDLHNHTKTKSNIEERLHSEKH